MNCKGNELAFFIKRLEHNDGTLLLPIGTIVKITTLCGTRGWFLEEPIVLNIWNKDRTFMAGTLEAVDDNFLCPLRNPDEENTVEDTKGVENAH